MKKDTLVLISTALLVLHSAEEFVLSLWQTDPLGLAVATFLGTSAGLVFGLGQVVLLALLAWLIIGRPRAAWPYWVLGTIMLFELDHIVRAIQITAYYPGLITAVALVGFGIYYWWQLLRVRAR